jgi:hypothetical protein
MLTGDNERATLNSAYNLGVLSHQNDFVVHLTETNSFDLYKQIRNIISKIKQHMIPKSSVIKDRKS